MRPSRISVVRWDYKSLECRKNFCIPSVEDCSSSNIALPQHRPRSDMQWRHLSEKDSKCEKRKEC
jgi:hypothetical protein